MGVTIPLSSASSRVAWAWAGVVGGATLGQVGGIFRPWNQPRLYLELYLPRAPGEGVYGNGEGGNGE